MALGKQTVDDNSSALGEFAFGIGAKTCKQWPGKGQWYDKLKGYPSDGTIRIHVNLDGISSPWEYVKPAAGVDLAASWEGYTLWEMYQLSQNPRAWDRVTWYRDGSPVVNPFGG